MTAYQNCKVSEVMPVTLPSGVAGAGYGFSIRSENKRPLVTLSFATREDAEQARAEVASAVEKAIEVTPQGWPRAAPADRLDALAAERARPWRRLVG
jgi:hypothetical protein